MINYHNITDNGCGKRNVIERVSVAIRFTSLVNLDIDTIEELDNGAI